MLDDLLPPGEPDLRVLSDRLMRLWEWAFMTPVMYALAAWVILSQGWVAAPGAATHPWDSAPMRWLLGGIEILLAVLLGVIRMRRRGVVSRLTLEREAAARRYTRQFLAMLCLADGFTFIALVYFCLSGRLLALLAGGALTYAGYFMARPGARDLAGEGRAGED